MNANISVKMQTYAGLFMITLATLMYEILLTRIFSVTMWYHFAFMAISISMFGMTVGALLVFLFPNFFTQEKAKYHLALSSFLLALTIFISFMTHLSVPVFTDKNLLTLVGVYSLALTYTVISVPFVFSGICVCIALTKFPRYISKLYAADLAGAAVGCLLLVYILKITDGPTAVFVIALLACIGCVFFLIGESNKKLMRIVLVSGILLLIFVCCHTVLVNKQSPLIRLMWVKGELETRPLYEKWNSFSRINISGNPRKLEVPFGWGISSAYSSDRKISQLYLKIDADALTTLTAFNGDFRNLEYLKSDIVNFAHYLRESAKVLVIGAGGGRDILSALLFNQKSVLGIEMNEDITYAVNQIYGDFTGHLDENPKVTFVNDEARSFITRRKDKFDIIQSSFTDTWAATAAGAYVFTESSLYTVEAWEIFIEHLTENGLLSFSRWYSDQNGAAYRLTSLASDALMRFGVENPRDHIVLLGLSTQTRSKPEDLGIGTIIVSKRPFIDEELDMIEKIAYDLQFDVLVNPRFSVDSTFAALASAKNLNEIYADFPLNIAPTTDDNPFFFYTVRLRSLFNRELWQGEKVKWGRNMAKPVFILIALLLIVITLTFLCIIVPLMLMTGKVPLRGTLPLLVFFLAIGFGFMLIEISQMQRLIIFLGHPIYSLSVVIFALLLSSGIGSYSTHKLSNSGLKRAAIVRLALLLFVLIIFGIGTLSILNMSQGSTTILRIIVSIAILFPLGLFMGMAFPIGMKIAYSKSALITPWLWGINGAASVCASVLAIAIALSLGISMSFWMGVLCYLFAFIAFVWATQKID